MWSDQKRGKLPYKECRAGNWDELVRISKYFHKQSKRKKRQVWIFRGQKGFGDLKTSLERAFREFKPDKKYDLRKLEKALIREFQRKALHYLEHVPELNDTLEWLALMQHHGAPTRLLDWTYSFYRAVYNAVENWKNESPKVEMWAFDTRWFSDGTEGKEEKKIPGILRDTIGRMNEENRSKEDKTILELLNEANSESTDYKGKFSCNRNRLVQCLLDREAAIPLVYNVTPFTLHQRLIIQQGTFLLPGNITKCFMQNLESYGNDCIDHLYRIVMDLTPQERNKVIEELDRMNINEAVLFPGLDGFARSLRMQLAFPHKFGNVGKPPKKKSTTNR